MCKLNETKKPIYNELKNFLNNLNSIFNQFPINTGNNITNQFEDKIIEIKQINNIQQVELTEHPHFNELLQIQNFFKPEFKLKLIKTYEKVPKLNLKITYNENSANADDVNLENIININNLCQIINLFTQILLSINKGLIIH